MWVSLAGVRCDLCSSLERHLCRPHLQVQQPQCAASSLCYAVQDPTKGERESLSSMTPTLNLIKLLWKFTTHCFYLLDWFQARVKLISTIGRDLLSERENNPRIKSVRGYISTKSLIAVFTGLVCWHSCLFSLKNYSASKYSVLFLW